MPAQPSRIRRLLDADETNSRIAPKLMANLHPWAVDAFDDTAAIFGSLYDALGDWEALHRMQQQLHELAERNGLNDDELTDRLDADQASDIEGVEALWQELFAKGMVQFVVMACQRYWSWGAAELFRFRHTVALGYLRLEVEAFALIVLFLENHSRARQWFELRTDADGQRFFRETQGRVKAILRQYKLMGVYDMASGSAQHVRMAGFIRSLRLHRPGEISLPDQELDRDDPYSFHLVIGHFHRVQARVLPALFSVLPDIRTPELMRLQSAYVRHAAELWTLLGRRYARRKREEQAGQAGANWSQGTGQST
jgi:hypothetical protein